MFKLFKHLFKQEEEHKKIAAEANKPPEPVVPPPVLQPIYSVEIQAVLDDYKAHPELWFINPANAEAYKHDFPSKYLRRKLVALDFCLENDGKWTRSIDISDRYRYSYDQQAYWVNPPPGHISITFAEAQALHQIFDELHDQHKAVIAAKFRQDILAKLAVTE